MKITAVDFKGRICRVYRDSSVGANEGIDWISGWHADDSADAMAMLAAWKLRGPKARTLEDASTAYTNGETSFEAWKANLDLWDAEFDEEMRRE